MRSTADSATSPIHPFASAVVASTARATRGRAVVALLVLPFVTAVEPGPRAMPGGPAAGGAAAIVLEVGATPASQTLTGAQLALPLTLDMSAAAGTALASVSGTVTWDPARWTFVSLSAGPFGTLTSNTANSAAGSVGFATFDANGTTTNQTLATLTLQARTTLGNTNVAAAITAAGDALGVSISSIVTTRAQTACINAAIGVYGDANGDAAVNIIDAQQIARFSVGLGVGNLSATQNNGDVTADGVVNIVDAQQVARFSVGLSAAARITTQVLSTCP